MHFSTEYELNRQDRQERQGIPNSFLVFLGALGVLGGSILFLNGCAAPHNGKPVPKELAGSDPNAQVNFWHELTDEPIASNDDAFHALLLFVDGKDDAS